MHRFFVPESRRSDSVALPEAEATHAVRVLRLAEGDTVTLLDGEGGEHKAQLERVSKREVTARIQKRLQHEPSRCEVTLVQAIAKGPAMEGLLHRAVELGCRRVVPLVADRSVSRPDSAQEKQARWQSVALEAAKQSGNPWRMHVDAPQTVKAWRARQERFNLTLIASLADAPHPLSGRWAAFEAQHQRAPRSVAVLVGPEGDFTPEEYAAFREDGALSITLGPYVLRVETAVTAVLAQIQAQLL